MLQSVSDLPVKPGNEDIIARASHDLANVYLRSGKVEQAGEALERALEIWKSDAAQFHDQILGAVLIKSQLMAETGDLEQAEAVLSESLPRRIAFSGETSLETAILLTNIGVARMRLGNIEGALGSSERARDVFSAIERLDTPDGLNAMNNLATLYHISGRLEEAEAAYLETLGIRQKLYGPSTALAVLMSNYGKLKLQQEKTAEAALLLSNAVEMADEFSGASSPAALAARFGLIEALANSEQIGEAEAVLTDVSNSFNDAVITSGAYMGLFYVASAQVAAAKGEPSAALASLDAADQIFAEMGAPAARYAAKAQQVRDGLNQDVAGTPL